MMKRQKNPQPTYKSQSTYLRPLTKIHFVLIGMAIVVLCLPLQAQKSQHYSSIRGISPKYSANFSHFDYADPNARKGGDITLASEGSFDSFNGYIIKGETAAGLGYIYNSLMKPSEDDNSQSVSYGLLAKSVTIDPNHKYAIFEIRDNAKWHDGKSVTAEDVVWTFNTLIESGSPQYKLYYGDVKQATATNRLTVRFDFKKANPELGYILGQLTILPKHYWQKKENDFTKTTLKPPLGSGPYKIDSFQAGKRIRYKRVPDYWAKDLNVEKGHYNFDTITFIYFANRTATREAVKSGEVDFFLENTAKEWATGYDTPAVREKSLIKEEYDHENPAGLQGFGFNIRRGLFKDIRVRKALSLAFDFEWANRTLFYGDYIRSKSFFNNSELSSKGLPSKKELTLLKPFEKQLPKSIFTEEFKPAKTDGSGRNRKNLLEASRLLKEAGYTIQSNQLRDKAGKPVSFEVLLYNPAFERVVAAYAQNLKKLGIKTDIKTVTTSEYIKRLNEFDFDMTVVGFGQSSSPGNEQYYFWGSKAASQNGSQNLIGIQNPVIDKLIDKLVVAKTREDLIIATRALDRVLLHNHYVVHHWYHSKFRLLYWDMFGRPKIRSPFSYSFNTWWYEPQKYEKIKSRKKS